MNLSPGWSVLWRVGVWLLFTVGFAFVAPILYLWHHSSADLSEVRSYVNVLLLALTSLGVYLAVASDLITEGGGRDLTAWVAVGLILLLLSYMARVAMRDELVRKTPAEPEDFGHALLIFVFTASVCTMLKARIWYKQFSRENQSPGS